MVSSPICTLPSQVQVRHVQVRNLLQGCGQVTVLKMEPGVNVEERNRLR